MASQTSKRARRRRAAGRPPSVDETAALRDLVDTFDLERAELARRCALLEETVGRLTVSQARFTELYDAAPLPQLSLDDGGRVRALNLAAARLFGRERRHLVGKPFVALAHVLGSQAFFAHLRACLRERRTVSTELSIRAADGARRHVELVSAPIAVAGGVEAASALYDLTERVRTVVDAEAAREEAELERRRALALGDAGGALATEPLDGAALERLAEVVVAALGGACVVDVTALEEEAAEEQRTVASACADSRRARRAERLFGRVRFGLLVAEDARALLVEEVTGPALERAAFADADASALGTLSIASLIVAPLVIDGRRAGALTLLSFAGERRFGARDVELVVELARRVAVSLQRVRGCARADRDRMVRDQQLRLVAHELDNSLAGISLLTRALVTREQSAGALRDHLGNIERAVALSRRLVRDLAGAAKRGSSPALSLAPTDLRPLLDEACAAFAPAATRKRQLLGVAATAYPARVLCDRERIAQVLANLVGNAIKYAPPFAVITVDARRDGAHVVISVADTGRGIPAAEQRAVFDHGWRGESNASGAGLGLYIARRIVEAHGGRIWLVSDEGAGAVFFFSLRSASGP